MTQRLAALLIACALALGPTGHAYGGKPGPKAMAAKGRKLYRQGKFVQAAEAFRKAHDMDPDPKLLFNVAKCLEKAGEYLEAMDAYQAYLRDWPEAPNRKDVRVTIRYLEGKALIANARVKLESEPSGAEVYQEPEGALLGRTPLTKWLPAGKYELRFELPGHPAVLKKVDYSRGGEQELRVRFRRPDEPGRITLTSAPPGLRVTLDGEPVGTTPLPRPIEAKPGTHELELTGDGYAPFVAGVLVDAGAKVDVKVAMVELAEPPRPRDDEPTGAGWHGPVFWSGLGLAAAGLAVGGGFLWMASESAADARNLSTVPGAQEDWQAKVDEADGRLVVADVGFGVAALGAGVALVAKLTEPDHGTEGAGGGARVTIVPALAPSGRGFSLSLTW